MNIEIKNHQNTIINTDLFRDKSAAKQLPLVIFCHGFKGFKDWGGFPYMMEHLAAGGFAAVSFNFTLNGVSKETPSEFSKPELFAQNTFSQELDDLHQVIDFFYNNAEKFNIDKNRIALMGHSRGGGIAVIKAKEDDRIKALVTLASVSTFDRYTEEQKKRWKETGYLEVENTRTKQIMKLNYTLLEDIEKNKERFDILKSISKLKMPILIIHGKEDLAVKSVSADELYANSDKENTELYIIENTGHTFGTVQPFAGTTKAFDKVLEKITSFLKAVL